MQYLHIYVKSYSFIIIRIQLLDNITSFVAAGSAKCASTMTGITYIYTGIFQTCFYPFGNRILLHISMWVIELNQQIRQSLCSHMTCHCHTFVNVKYHTVVYPYDRTKVQLHGHVYVNTQEIQTILIYRQYIIK